MKDKIINEEGENTKLGRIMKKKDKKGINDGAIRI